MNTESKSEQTRSPRPVAERQRVYRRRRQRGLRPFKVELNGIEIDELVKRGYLPPTDREDVRAIEDAATAAISDALMTS